MKTRIQIILILSSAIIFGASFLPASSAQKRLGQFSHNTKAHKEGRYKDCSSCHTMPTKNWATARQNPYPDVATFPSHASCFGCHEKDIYSRTSGFCGSCHVVAGPLAKGGKGVLLFPMKSHSLQFNTIFPHDVHQNLIASNDNKDKVAVGHFVLASYTSTAPDTKTQFYNCAICHSSSAKMPKFTTRGITREKALAEPAADIFTPTAKTAPEFFKDGPDSHASCFTCHYQNVKPAATDCAGCHALTAPYFEKNVIQRYSLKFSHQSTNHANKDCTTCHVRITQNSDVAKMKDADVPFQTCSTSSCHGSNISAEIGKREESITGKQPAFQCAYCHTSAIGRYEIPPSHRKP